jgi:hypothetical protein
MVVVEICDMRSSGKAGYVARLGKSDRVFLRASGYPDGHGGSTKRLQFEISDPGLYEICDANYGGRKRKISYLAILPGGEFEEFESRKDAENYLNPPAAQKAEPVDRPDVKIGRLKDGRLKVELLSDAAFKFFLPDLKSRVPGRVFNQASKCWVVPPNSVLQLREVIEERTDRTNGIRACLRFDLSEGTKMAMGF